MKMVQIELDKKRILKFGTRSFVEIEKALDTPIEKIDFDRQETIYALLYGGLKYSDKKITLDKVYDIVDGMIDKLVDEENLSFMEGFSKVLNYIGEKIKEAMGNKVDEKPNEEW